MQAKGFKISNECVKGVLARINEARRKSTGDPKPLLDFSQRQDAAVR
jgi:hypothetical protein